MPEHDPTRLPIHPHQRDGPKGGDVPTCSPKIYVSNEEASLLRELRALRERALAVRHQLTGADSTRRHELETEMDELRARRGELVRRREAAFRRKMVMLGHLPPGSMDEEITR